MNCIIGVDIGTTSTKTIAFDLGGQVIAKADAKYPILYPEPTYCEQDPEEILRAVVSTLRRVTDELKKGSHSPLGVSFSGAMHSLIAMDEQGKPLTNSIIWADTRSKEYATRIKHSPEGHTIYLRTGTPIHPMTPLCKLAWLRDHSPDVFRRAHKFISIKEYVFRKLFNQYVVDYSIASATGLFDIRHLRWCEPALAAAGITAERLSELVPPTHVVSDLADGLAEALGLEDRIPFVVGASDGCLAQLSANAIRPGRASLTIGTSGAVRVAASVPAQDAHERVFSYVLTEGTYVVGGPINSGGVVFRWFRDQFAAPETEEAARTGTDPYDLLIQKATVVPAGADGLIFLPYLLGERAPIWDADARGVFFGVSIGHTRAHFIRALMEGIVFGLYSVGLAVEENTAKIDVLYAGGGFARSDFWLQIVADVFNKPVRVAESVESSALGAAAMGLLALGVLKEMGQVEQMLPASREIAPDAGRHATYRKNYDLFASLYGKLKEDFAKLSELAAPAPRQ
ncbi:MAG: gluconokinase [Ferruginibacter sp.]|nr:gluconokinase [Cytophagales bacterium]